MSIRTVADDNQSKQIGNEIDCFVIFITKLVLSGDSKAGTHMWFQFDNSKDLRYGSQTLSSKTNLTCLF